MERNTMQDNKFFMGEKEFTNLIKVLTRAYRFRNKNQNPEAIVIPDITEVDGVRIEFPKETSIEGVGQETSEPGSPDS